MTDVDSRVGVVSRFGLDWIDDHLYGTILRSFEQTHCARMWFCMSDALFRVFVVVLFSSFFEYPPKWCTYSAGMAGAI